MSRQTPHKRKRDGKVFKAGRKKLHTVETLKPMTMREASLKAAQIGAKRPRKKLRKVPSTFQKKRR